MSIENRYENEESEVNKKLPQMFHDEEFR